MIVSRLMSGEASARIALEIALLLMSYQLVSCFSTYFRGMALPSNAFRPNDPHARYLKSIQRLVGSERVLYLHDHYIVHAIQKLEQSLRGLRPFDWLHAAHAVG